MVSDGSLINGEVGYNRSVSKLDLDYFEKIVCYRSLFDSVYLTTIIDYIAPTHFKDKNISTIFTIVKDFYNSRNKIPTITEVKSYLTTDDLKSSFKTLVESFRDIDKKINIEELN